MASYCTVDMTTATASDRVEEVWRLCCESYLRIANRRLAMPKGTDPKKTYQWRYLVALDKKLSDLEISSDGRADFIDAVVQYARERNLLHKGLSIFMQSNLLDEVYRRLRERSTGTSDTVSVIRRSKEWLDATLAASNCSSAVELLLERDSIGSYPNIVKWHQAGYLPELFLALSRSCGLAISRLSRSSNVDRASLPPDIRLFLLRTSALSARGVTSSIRDVLLDEWRQ